MLEARLKNEYGGVLCGMARCGEVIARVQAIAPKLSTRVDTSKSILWTPELEAWYDAETEYVLLVFEGFERGEDGTWCEDGTWRETKHSRSNRERGHRWGHRGPQRVTNLETRQVQFARIGHVFSRDELAAHPVLIRCSKHGHISRCTVALMDDMRSSAYY